MPSEASNGHVPDSAASRGWRAAIMPLRKLKRRIPPDVI
jgi:hypothetical protein